MQRTTPSVDFISTDSSNSETRSYGDKLNSWKLVRVVGLAMNIIDAFPNQRQLVAQ